MKQTRSILLASESPQRIQILQNAGFNFKVKVSPYEEPELPYKAEELAKTHALGKIIKLLPMVDTVIDESIFLGVDTIVHLNGTILQKPRDEADARQMLLLQQGQIVEVISGFALIDPQTGKEFVDAVTTKVFMSSLSTSEIDWYLKTNEWQGKSGGFAIQGLASRFFQKVDGDILNVIGLPLNAVYQILKAWQVFV